MEKFVTFISDNYVWFLVVSIFLIFALIGYLYDTRKNKDVSNNDYLNEDSLGNMEIDENNTLNSMINNNNGINNNQNN